MSSVSTVFYTVKSVRLPYLNGSLFNSKHIKTNIFTLSILISLSAIFLMRGSSSDSWNFLMATSALGEKISDIIICTLNGMLCTHLELWWL